MRVNGVVLPLNETAAGVPEKVTSRSVPVVVATTIGGSCPTAGSSCSWTRSTCLCGTMIALVPALEICCQIPWSRLPPAASAARALSRRASASASILRSETRSAGHLSRQLLVDLRRHALRRKHGDLRQGAHVLGRGARDGRLRTGRDPGEHEDARERRHSCERHDAQRSPSRLGERRPHPGRQRRDDRPCRADDPEGAEQGNLRPELRRLRRDQQHREESDRDGVNAAADPSQRGRLRVGDHEEEEDHDLRREHDDPPELEAGDRAEVPARRHLVARGRDHADSDRERDPERDRDREQMKPREDRERADEDDREREHHPRRHRPPPERERIGVRGTEQHEAEHEAEVRRVEDVMPANPDHVLGENRYRGRGGEDPPAVEAPPVTVRRARHAEDEGDAVPGQERARGPHDHALLVKGDRELDHRACRERDEDLGDRELEAEGGLPQDLERDDHERQVEPRVAYLRQQDRVLRAANPQRRSCRTGQGRRVHRVPMVLAESSLRTFGNCDFDGLLRRLCPARHAVALVFEVMLRNRARTRHR